MTRMPRKYTFRLGTASLLCALLLAGACTPTIAQRGNMLEDYQIAEIRAGESTRSDVLRNLGSPTTQSTFDPNVWYYIGQETEKRGILDPKVTQERVVLVAFNEDGTGKVPFVLLQYQNGRPELIWPQEFAKVDFIYPAPPFSER